MPHTTAVVDNRGPIITVHIGISSQRRAALTAAGSPIPQPIACNLLIDTGASGTCIDASILQQLGITPTGSISMHTPSTGNTPHPVNTYDVSMVILGSPGPPKVIGALQVIECNFSSQGLEGLLGRDVLAFSRLIYSGHDNLVMLSIL